MRRIILWIAAFGLLGAAGAEAQSGIGYHLIHEGKNGDGGRMRGYVTAPATLWFSDPLGEKALQLTPQKQYKLDYDARGLAVYCVSRSESGKEICHLLMQPNFGFEGVEQVLLGGRGERFVYVELARCTLEERNCLWPHRRLGQPATLKLVQQGDEPKVFNVGKTHRVIAAGPFKPEAAEAALNRIAKVVPSARIVGESEVR